jgi:hypothetical protein
VDSGSVARASVVNGLAVAEVAIFAVVGGGGRGDGNGRDGNGSKGGSGSGQWQYVSDRGGRVAVVAMLSMVWLCV